MKKVFIDIHQALHDKSKTHITIDNVDIHIQTRKEDNLRFVVFKNGNQEYEVMEQNPHTRSPYAKLARQGESISWVIPRIAGARMTSGWKMIDDGTKVNN